MVVVSTRSRLCILYGFVIRRGRYGCHSRIFFLWFIRSLRPSMNYWRKFFSIRSTRKVAMFAIVEWCLWQCCNRIRERQPSWQLHELGDHAQRLVDEFWNMNSQEHGVSIPRPVVH